MKAKSFIFFILALAVSFFAATYRWGDSAHAIGLIKASGGEARHPAYFEAGGDRYALIATASVVPPYRGDARVVLEGSPAIDHRISLSGPAVDLGLRRNPELRDNVIRGLQPKDRIALWVLMRPPPVDPVCGMASGPGSVTVPHAGREYFFCSEACAEAFRDDPGKYKDNDRVRGRYTLALYDVMTNRAVLTVPVIFKGKGGPGDAGGHQH